jgi:signal peptidase I
VRQLQEQDREKEIDSIPFKKILDLVLFIVAVIILVIVFIGNAKDDSKTSFSIFDRRPVVVVSGSMLPEIQINSLAIMQYCTIDDLEVGDIAVYNHPTLKIMITHRVIEKNVVEGDSDY